MQHLAALQWNCVTGHAQGRRCRAPGPRRQSPAALMAIGVSQQQGEGFADGGYPGAGLGQRQVSLDLVSAVVRVVRNAQQHPGVAGQETPARRTDRLLSILDIYC